MRKTPEKWQVNLWDTVTPKIGLDKRLLRREYGKQSSVNRALPGLWRAYPSARLAVVSHFKFNGLFWIAGSGSTTRIPRAGWCWRGHEVTSEMTSCPECGAVLSWQTAGRLATW